MPRTTTRHMELECPVIGAKARMSREFDIGRAALYALAAKIGGVPKETFKGFMVMDIKLGPRPVLKTRGRKRSARRRAR
jgi:hypothetical protein